MAARASPAGSPSVRQEAAGAGISERTLAALDGLTFDDRVLKQDRGQPTLSQSFLDFADRVVSADRLARGRALLKKHAETFARIERDFGVPGPVIAAFWGLETDYGAFTGDFSSLRSLATLAYDCRRPDHFRAELIDALQLLESGDLVPEEMTGAWAGELGQVQFTPSNYLKYAVDYDGDGRRDLVGSVPDALASTANYLKAIGWRANEPWLEEVRVGEGVPWQEAARANLKPRSFWAAAGVTRADGSALPADDVSGGAAPSDGAARARPSSATRISASTGNGTRARTIRSPPPISPRGSAVRARLNRGDRSGDPRRRTRCARCRSG